MAIYKCEMCEMFYDEEKEGVPFSALERCPFCGAPLDMMLEVEAQADEEAAAAPANTREYPYMNEIHEMAKHGKSIVASMGTLQASPSWNDILILGSQLNPPPLEEDEDVDLTTIIGPHAKKPMVLAGPVFVSHMSFGALSSEAKVALAKGSAAAGTAICSGEGGILPAEKSAAAKYILEYVPNKYSITEENLREADAIEIKIGQGTKPGMGGLLPGAKVTPEIAAIRQKPVGQDVISPAKFPEINSKEDLKQVVESLREMSGGRPIGVKIAAGHIERDLEYCVFSKPDFITIDGRGGGSGASPQFVRDSTSVPTVFALWRAKKYLKEHAPEIQLVITGGLRISADFAKALAMGADAVAVASAAMLAIGCQQYRICNTGFCPMGIATQDPELRKRIDVEGSAERLANYLRCSFEELKTFARITGRRKISALSQDDLASFNRVILDHTDIAAI